MNVDINKEVQRAMMSPSQDQGIVNLLASELKARDAKARQQINSLMAGQPDPNSIMAQNEREVENSVRQEIGQKMQARVMQERQAQARQRQALAGIAGQRASNMRMADGGIVGYAEGGMPRFPRLFDFSMFLAEKGIDSLAGLSADAVNRLTQEYQAMQAREMNRPRGDSMSESQMENLGGVLRGAGNVLTEGIASLAPEPQGRNRTELADMGGAPGAGGAPQARREPSAADLADAQAEMDILNAAQRRRDEAGRRQGLEALEYYDPAEGAEALKRAAAETRAIRVDEPEEGLLGQLGRLFRPSSAQRAASRAEDAERSRISGTLQEFRDRMSRPLDELEYYDPNAPKQTDVEVAEEIITTAPSTTTAASTEDADAAAMKGVPQIANPSLRRAIEGTQETPAPAQEAVIDTASTVAQNPTPENTSRFESEIQRLMERRESPMRALSDFLTSFSQARGGSLGQNLAIATTGLRAADDALDKQIVELEKLRRADQISERDFNLKKDQLTVERSYRDAMAAYYKRIPEVQLEVEQLRQAGKDIEADRRLREAAVAAVLPYRMMFTTMAEEELGRGASSTQIRNKADELFKEQIDMFVDMARGPQNAGAANFGDQFADTMTVTP